VKTQHIRKLVLKLELGIDLPKVRQYLRVAQKQMEAEKRFSTVHLYFDVDPL
jgi:primosomal protein N' (replication factor Y)